MQAFVCALDENYHLDGYRIKEKTVILRISSLHNELKCPYCNTVSRKVHSTYDRAVQDLPMQDKKVILLVRCAR